MLSTHTFQYNPVLFPTFPGYDFKRSVRHLAHPRTIIGNDVWLGAQTVVKSGISIGNGAVVAANSVVTKDIPPYAIAVGSPAVVRRLRFSTDVVDRLNRSEWWRLPIAKIFTLPFDDIVACLDLIEQFNIENFQEAAQ